VKEVVTFGTVGAVNTLLGLAIFNLVFTLGALTAQTISTVIATGVSYVLNRHVTYRHRPRTALRRELPLFALFNLIGLGLQLGLLALGRWGFHLNHDDRLGLNLVRFGGVAVGTVFLLLTYRTFVFKNEKLDPATAGALTETIEVGSILPLQVRLADDDFAELTTPLEAELAGREPADTEEPATTSSK
jgi:putative flippase GtrA